MDMWISSFTLLFGCTVTGIMIYRKAKGCSVEHLCNDLDHQLARVKALHSEVLNELEAVKTMGAKKAAKEKVSIGA